MKLAVIANLVISASALSIAPEFKQAAKAIAVAGALTLSVVNAAFAGDVAAGKLVFNVNCAACHAGGQNVIMPEKTLEKEALDQFLSGGRSEESVVKQVSKGKNAMPAFGGRLEVEDIENVATYVIFSSEDGWN